MADLSGQQLGPYRLQRKIGQGGMGAVYVGVHQTLQSSRAIKVLLPTEVDEAVVERFVREGIISASLRHRNIVEIFDVGEQDDIHYLVMEWVDGHSLLEVLRESGALPLDRAINLLRQIADALDFAHARGVVHRDIKPSNIIVEPDDAVTLIDFGIARAMDESRLTRVGVVVGTFEYMAPEVVTEGGGTPGADRYALGIVAYQMLTGRAPFTGESAHSIMYKQVHEPPPPPTRFRPELTATVEAALLRQLSKEPEGRFPSSSAFVDALADTGKRIPMQTEATSIAEITRPGFDRPTPGSGQTPLPQSGRVTRPVVTAATLTPPGAQVLPNVQPPAAPLTIPQAPLTGASRFTAAAGPGTVLGTPQLPARKSSAGLIFGIAAALAVLVLAGVMLSPLRATVMGLVVSAPPATATVAAQAKPVVTPPTPGAAVVSESKPVVTAGPTSGAATGPTIGTAAQPKPAITPSATLAPTAPPTAAAPPTLTPDQRLAQARDASAAGNHPAALALLDELRKANTALPSLDDAQYDIHMAFAQALLQQNNPDGAYEQFGAALKLRPNDPAAKAGQDGIILAKNYAIMEAAWGKDDDAGIKALEENMRINPDFRETRPKLYALLIMKADRQIAAGERDAAFEVLMRALAVMPDAGEAQKRLASYTPTPEPTATPRPVVVPQQQAAPQSKPANSGGGTYSPAPASGSGSSGSGSGAGSGGRSCPGGVCP